MVPVPTGPVGGDAPLDPLITTVEAPGLAPDAQIHLRAYAPPEAPADEVWMYTIVTAPWPPVTQIADARLGVRSLLRRSGILHGRWPWVRFQVRNGHAIYKLGTCDLGAFDATLVDSAFTVFPMGGPHA